MRRALGVILAGTIGLGGCAYFPRDPDPIRIVDSPADVGACRRLGSTGAPVRTDGKQPYFYGSLTKVVPAGSPAAAPAFGTFGVQPTSDNLAVRLDGMRDAALALGATDLLLVRRTYRDWSYVEGVAYRCRV